MTSRKSRSTLSRWKLNWGTRMTSLGPSRSNSRRRDKVLTSQRSLKRTWTTLLSSFHSCRWIWRTETAQSKTCRARWNTSKKRRGCLRIRSGTLSISSRNKLRKIVVARARRVTWGSFKLNSLLTLRPRSLDCSMKTSCWDQASKMSVRKMILVKNKAVSLFS